MDAWKKRTRLHVTCLTQHRNQARLFQDYNHPLDTVALMFVRTATSQHSTPSY